jgi:hypothetical protein
MIAAGYRDRPADRDDSIDERACPGRCLQVFFATRAAQGVRACTAGGAAGPASRPRLRHFTGCVSCAGRLPIDIFVISPHLVVMRSTSCSMVTAHHGLVGSSLALIGTAVFSELSTTCISKGNLPVAAFHWTPTGLMMATPGAGPPAKFSAPHMPA